MSQHPIVHIEFSANDGETAGKFYSELFGWKITYDPALNYTMFESSEGAGGGFSPVSKENPAGTVMVYIGTDDIGATLAKAESLGGKTVVPKSEIPGMGWFAMFSDPTGNVVGLYTGRNP
jgi:hypothetical protein